MSLLGMVLHEGRKQYVCTVREVQQLISFQILRLYILKCWLVIEGLGTDARALARLLCVIVDQCFNTQSLKFILFKISIMRLISLKSYTILKLHLHHSFNSSTSKLHTYYFPVLCMRNYL